MPGPRLRRRRAAGGARGPNDEREGRCLRLVRRRARIRVRANQRRARLPIEGARILVGSAATTRAANPAALISENKRARCRHHHSMKKETRSFGAATSDEPQSFSRAGTREVRHAGELF